MMRNSCRALSTCLVLLGSVLSHEAHAAILTVTSLADDGSTGTLRSKVAAAAAGDTIDFSVTGTLTLTGSTGIAITRNVTITGPGAGSLTVAGNASSSIFTTSGGVVGISGLTLTNGNGTAIVDASGNKRVGGAIYVSAGAATVSGCTISGSRADYGGGIYLGGGSLTVTGSTISGNDLGNTGSGGGIYVNAGPLTVTGSTISGNTANRGGGLYNSGGTVTLTGCTFSANTAAVAASTPLYGWGGGIFNNDSMTLVNCTVSGNDARGYGGTTQIGGGGIWSTGTLTISNSTIAANFAAQFGGGILSVSGPTTLFNSIVAANLIIDGGLPTYGEDLSGPVSGNYNLVQNGAISGTNNLTGQDAALGALSKNGGPTHTHLLLQGSPAIDAGDPNFDATNTPWDQRGPGYPRVRNGRLCMGAFESEVSQSGSSIIVNTLDDHDDGAAGPTDCSLREAVRYAPAGATITFGVTGTITLPGVDDIPIAKNLTITGPGAGSLTVNRINYGVGIFNISSGIVSISGLTLSGGGGSSGGAIYMTGGTVTIASTTLSDNSAKSGGAIYVGGGTLAVTDSTLSNNEAEETGGAIAVAGGTLTVSRSTISDNRAYRSGAGIITFVSFNTATIEDSTISGNIVPLVAAVPGHAGGINNNSFMIIRNCTISGNRSEAVSGTGLTGGGGIKNRGVLTIANSTITNNFADKAGGIMNDEVGTLDLSNTILAGNSVSGYGPDILSGPSTGTHNIVGQDPKLGPLANNGGPTLTHALLVGSPAIDAGDPAFDGTNLPYDQRGPGFPRLLNGRVCIGACEANFDQGSSFIVNTLDDHDDGIAGTNDCTLREAVRYASVGGSITFSVAGTITLTGVEMLINKNLTITGPTNAPGITVSGNNASRIFRVTQGATAVSNTVNFSNLTLSGGNGVGSFQSGVGGAIHSDTYTPPMIMTVTNCTLSGNHAEAGGAIRNGGPMTVTGSTFSGNSAISAGAIQNGPNVLTLTNSTFSGNSATGNPANGYGIGGALRSAGSPTVTSCTFSGNTATLRGGAIEIAAGATPSFSNTIVAGNSAPTGPDINGTITAGDYNLVQNMTNATLSGTHNITGPANLGALANNGGPTQTHALLAGSLAINAGSNALIPGGVTTDQCGFARVQSSTVDIGAFEVDPAPLTLTINQAAGQTDPTISTPVLFTVVFSKPVNNFTTGDVSLSGSAGATTATVTGSSPTYQVAVAGMARSGTVIATIATNVALDASANGNAVSTSTDNSIYYSSPETVQHSGTIRAVEGGGGGFDVGFIGNPGQEYIIQFSSDMTPSDWHTLRTQAANPSGVISIVDNPPTGTLRRFYRLLLP